MSTQPHKPGLDNGDPCPRCGQLQMPKWSEPHQAPGWYLKSHQWSENARCCQNCSFIEEKYPKRSEV